MMCMRRWGGRLGMPVAMVAFALGASPAPAEAQTVLQGGGATLPSLVLRQLFDCYGVPPGGHAASPVPAGCPARVNPNAQFVYNSVGSGAGQRGWVSQNPALMGGSPLLSDVNFGVSDAALSGGAIIIVGSGGRFSATGPTDIADQADNCVAPAIGTGQDSPVLGTGCHDNPRIENGPAIQIPIVGTAVTLAFDRAYKKVRLQNGATIGYRLQFVQRANNSGGLKLSREAVCGIFSGEIRRWDHNRITTDNGGIPVWPDPLDPAPQPAEGLITVVTRDDDSGTTSLLTRALRAQCAQFVAPLPSGFSQRFPGSPAATIPSGSTQCLGYTNTAFNAGRWIAARGSEGVASCLRRGANSYCTPDGLYPVGSPCDECLKPRLPGEPVPPGCTIIRTDISSRIGYVSPDFVRPFVDVQPYKGYGLNTADIENKSGNFIAPTIAATTVALGALAVPSGPQRANPIAWVADPSGADPVANPVADPPAATAYPIVGTTNLLLYTCYSSTAKAEALARTTGTEGFLNWFYGNRSGVNPILNASGFSPLPVNLRNAIVQTFATPGNAQNLFIRPVTGPATPAPDCTTGG